VRSHPFCARTLGIVLAAALLASNTSLTRAQEASHIVGGESVHTIGKGEHLIGRSRTSSFLWGGSRRKFLRQDDIHERNARNMLPCEESRRVSKWITQKMWKRRCSIAFLSRCSAISCAASRNGMPCAAAEVSTASVFLRTLAAIVSEGLFL
jgi:hypothetical protein